LLNAAELSGNDTSLGSYPDEETAELVRRPAPLTFLPTPSSGGSGVDVPFLDYNTSDEDRLLMGHCPPLRLCAPAESFTQGATARFGEAVTLQRPAACIAVTTSASSRDRSPSAGVDHGQHGRC
jgi:hypothetical protein